MARIMNIQDEILINQFVQHYKKDEELIDWFNTYPIKDKRKIICDILDLVIQAHPTYEEIEIASNNLGLNNSTPFVILSNKNKPFSKFGYKLSELPKAELNKVFLLLINILMIADNRRRQLEAPGSCHHWWHKDLSDAKYIEFLIQEYHGER